jgi:hypothetical protein
MPFVEIEGRMRGHQKPAPAIDCPRKMTEMFKDANKMQEDPRLDTN